MRIHGSRVPIPPNPYAEFNGDWSGAAINAMIQAATPGDTIYLPGRIFTLETIVFDRKLNVVCPPGGTKIYGSLAVTPRPLYPSDPGWAQIAPSIRPTVQVIDLKANGITDWNGYDPFTGPNSSGGSYAGWAGGDNITALAPPALICDDKQMELVRWPVPSAIDEPWTFDYVGTITTTNKVFACTDIPTTWNTNNWGSNNRSPIALYPGWNTESADYFTSATINPISQVITLDNAVPPASSNYYQPTQHLQSGVRFAIQNVLETLSTAGQYYIDVNNFLIYFIPPFADPAHTYRVSWATAPLAALQANWVSSCGGIVFSGGPLGLYGCRGQGFVIQGPPLEAPGGLDDVTFGSLQAFGIGEDAFQFQTVAGGGPFTNWTIGQLVVDWCGGAGISFGAIAGTGAGSPPFSTPPTGFPTLDPWNCNLGAMYFSRTCQWCRSARGALHMVCVDTTIEYIVSVLNPNHHFIHGCHDFTVNGGYFEATNTEGGDVGVIYSAENPTIFGTVLNDICIVNIPPFTSYTSPQRNVPTDRRGIYIDNLGSGVTARNSVFYACNSYSDVYRFYPDYCIYINGGQANIIDGVTTIDCVMAPVGMTNLAVTLLVNPWSPGTYIGNTNFAFFYYTLANQADGRYATKYGLLWNQMPSSAPYLGAPRNNSILRVTPFFDPTATGGSSGQPLWDENALLDYSGKAVSVDQPQGAVSPTPLPATPPFPPPPSW